MKESMLLTILAGVSVFVIGQFILKLVLDPIVTFKMVLGELSAFFLKEQAKITNATATEDIQIEIKRLSSSIIAHRQAIPCYCVFAFILRLPGEKLLVEACRSLNFISHQVNPNLPVGGSQDRYLIIHEEIKKISSNLKVRIDYKEL